jgi:hypothetical protein
MAARFLPTGRANLSTSSRHSAAPHFEEGMQYVFRKNVAKARRENKRILGSADIVPRKG